MDLSYLMPLYEQPGPFATAYVDVSRTTEAARRVTLEWRRTRETLLDQGASEPTIAAMDEAIAVTTAPGGLGAAGPLTQVLVGAGGRVLLNDDHPGTAAAPRASWAALPDLLPMLAAAPPRVPYLVARVDRVGADLTVYGPRDMESAEVRGGTYPIRKVGPGGWSQRRYQQRAENLWAANSRHVADQVERLAKRHRTRLIVLAGDGRAKSALVHALSDESRAEIVDVEGGRAAGADEKAMWESAQQAVADRGASESTLLLERLDAERGRNGQAVEGLSGTISALRDGQVEVLFVDGEGVSRKVFVGPEPRDLARSEADVLGGEATSVRADAALVRAAAANNARLVTVDPADCVLRDGVAALLRYASRS